jgi:hypothetical protein
MAERGVNRWKLEHNYDGKKRERREEGGLVLWVVLIQQ